MRCFILSALLFVSLGCGDDGSAGDSGVPDDTAVAMDTDVGGDADTGSPSDTSVPSDTSIPPVDAGPPSNGTWDTRAPLLAANSECAVAQLDGDLYIVGGYPSDRVTVDTVQVYDIAADSWRITTPLPQPINHTVAAAVGGRVYVIGGQTSSGGGDSYVDDVYEFDPSTEMWRSRAPMPTRRSAQASAVIDGLIYVAGGRPPQGQDFAVYDPAADSWTELPPLPTGRNHMAAGAIGDSVYVAGGRFGGGFSSEFTGIVEIFDTSAGTWSTGEPMPTPRSGNNGIAVGDCFYTWGGEFSGGVFEENEVYHAPTDTWRALAPMATPIHGVVGAGYLDGLIYAPGGGTERGGSSGSTWHLVFETAGTCP